MKIRLYDEDSNCTQLACDISNEFKVLIEEFWNKKLEEGICVRDLTGVLQSELECMAMLHVF